MTDSVCEKIDFCEKKILASLQTIDSALPHITSQDSWTLSSDQDWEETAGGYWTGGFWAGCLWLLYDLTGKALYRKKAYEVLKRLEPRREGKGHHDLGFVFFPSFCLGYRFTGDPYLRKIALDAATSLREIFYEEGGIIPIRRVAPEGPGRLAIDTMMNLPLLWWAHEETADVGFLRVAISHADQSLRYLIREDGSTIHLLEFQTAPFRTIGPIKLQGYSSDSAWSRGVAWAIYGFIFAYKATSKSSYLDHLMKMIDFYLGNVPDDWVSFYDFMDPNSPHNIPRDSSTAAILASALMEMGGHPLQNDAAKTCGELARDIIGSLSTKYLVNEGDGILAHGCFHRPAGIGENCSLIFGDYYYLEALWKIQLGKTITHSP